MNSTTNRSRLLLVALMICLAAGLGGQDVPRPVKSGINKSTFDQDVRPQDDLFRYVNGGWLTNTKIPPERSRDGIFDELRDRTEASLRQIIETAARRADSPDGRKIGDLYAAFMDEAKIEALAITPIEDQLAAIDRMSDKADLATVLATIQREGASGLFNLQVASDDKRPDECILYLWQGGTNLPDESYYREAAFAKKRVAYVAHIRRMFELAGRSGAAAEKVMALETRLAKGHWDRVAVRDAAKTYNRFDRDSLARLSPGFAWASYFEHLGAQGVAHVVVRQPSYFTAMASAIDEVPLDDLKAWLTWSVLHSHAPLMAKAVAEEDFNFFGSTLTGTTQQRPRWKRGVAAVESSLGDALGKMYVERHFSPKAKARLIDLVQNLIKAYRQEIEGLDWMGAETRAKALVKLSKFRPKIGHPETWRDYSTLEIRRDDPVGNARRSAAFELAHELAKIGKPVDRDEWRVSPQTVDAFYNAGRNEIVFPAAILQPPFYDPEVDDAVNYGGIGAFIGHEISHGFDDQGSKYDGDGRLSDWWTEADRKEFERRSRALIEQYSGFAPAQLPDRRVNGALTIGENIGDLGGVTIACKAYKIALDGRQPPILDDLTGLQRLFIGWSQVWRMRCRDEELIRRLATDPHAPPEFRCNGVVRNLDEFHEAFDVKAGDKLWLPPERRVRIW